MNYDINDPQDVYSFQTPCDSTSLSNSHNPQEVFSAAATLKMNLGLAPTLDEDNVPQDNSDLIQRVDGAGYAVQTAEFSGGGVAELFGVACKALSAETEGMASQLSPELVPAPVPESVVQNHYSNNLTMSPVMGA